MNTAQERRSRLRRYTVDLARPAGERWDDMLTDRWACRGARELCEATYRDLETRFREHAPVLPAWFPVAAARAAAGSMPGLYRLLDDRSLGYAADIDVWCTYAVPNRGKALLGNFAYETAMLSARFTPAACTSVVFESAFGMVHARNMDWPLPLIRTYTVLVDHIHAPAGDFTSVGVPGYVGILSACARGRFSAHVNQAPCSEGPCLGGWSSAYALRWVFENCPTYDDAVDDLLNNTRSVFPFFVQLAGPKRGQACIIHVMPSGRNRCASYEGTPLGLSNHWPLDEDYRDTEWEEDNQVYYTDSLERLQCITRAAARCRPKTMRGVFAPLKHDACVWNDNTCQSMVMNPRTGEIRLMDTITGEMLRSDTYSTDLAEKDRKPTSSPASMQV